MIYLVTGQLQLFNSDNYQCIAVDTAINMLQEWAVIQFDTETEGTDPHICRLLTMQFGNKKAGHQIVVDCATINVSLFKKILESKLLIMQNGKFDLQFLYKHKIIPRKVYDTMVVEQLLYLGYPSVVNTPQAPYEEMYNNDGFSTSYILSYSLKSIAKRYLGIDMDKSVRGEIIWRGLDEKVILYAAKDVEYLEDIMWAQVSACKVKGCLAGAKVECDFIPALAYLEWCGIKLDENKWKAKMDNDQKSLKESHELLDEWLIDYAKDRTDTVIKASTQKGTTVKMPWISINKQGDLFSGFDLKPKANINWSSPKHLEILCKELGFNTTTVDKKTGEDKGTVLEKNIKPQKGINDKFLELYFNYKEHYKVCSTYGQKHLNAINPITGRIHTTYKQLGAISGRMSCGSKQSNYALAKIKKLAAGEVSYPNIQQLPSDEQTRSAFVSEEGKNFLSCDYSALESRLGADIYNEKAMLDEFLHGGGDMHSLCAKMVFSDELKDTAVKEVKHLRPDLRKRVKSVEFAKQFGGSAMAIAGSLGCSMEEAEQFSKAYDNGFKGVTAFAKKGSADVKTNGYVQMCAVTGHKMWWWDHDVWVKTQKSYTMEFWQEYRERHKGTNDEVAQSVRRHFQAASKWARMALNAPTQGTGSIIIKTAATHLFNYIVYNNYFETILLCAIVHDELCLEYPENLEDFPKLVEDTMLKAAAIYCKSLPIPAEASVAKHWVH